MAEGNKKRGNSFRKIFPNIFFSKNKDKSLIKEKNKISNKNNNFYQNPQNVNEFYTKDHDECIYENLSTASLVRKDNNFVTDDVPSNHSSSSTLVSEEAKNTKQSYNVAVCKENKNITYLAKPQVPPKPKSEPHVSKNEISLPGVYYHSLEKLTDKILPSPEQIEIYKSTKVQANPASVGAEIKRVSTKFLISPKKEADVRKIQPIRARSLSPKRDESQFLEYIPYKIEPNKLEKPYNYSAPTSPIVAGHKVPNMPVRISPYERVRKNIIEAEEKQNSMKRSDAYSNSVTFPTPIHNNHSYTQNINLKDHIKKEKTRQRVEAFYWQKIKTLKQKEDEYLLRHSVNSSMSKPKTNSEYYLNGRHPISHVINSNNRATRSPDINYNSNENSLAHSPFTRGVPERRSDSCVSKKIIFHSDAHMHNMRTFPDKSQNVKPQWPIFRRGSLKHAKDSEMCRYGVVQSYASSNDHNSDAKMPPVPPTRTTSFMYPARNYTNRNKNMLSSPTAMRSMCCASESGSEASEIRQIMGTQICKVNKRRKLSEEVQRAQRDKDLGLAA